MAGGGHIIIRNSVVATGSLGAVKDKLSTDDCEELNTLLAKDHWTHHELKRVQDFIHKAYKTYTE